MAEKRPSKEPSFRDAVDEVEQILARLEGEEVDIDDLSREVKRAVELIKLCRSKLEKTDSEVRELVADLGVEEEAASGKSPLTEGNTPAHFADDAENSTPF